MRIAIDIKALCLNRGGTAVYLKNLLTSLNKVDQSNHYFPIAPPGLTFDDSHRKPGILSRWMHRLNEIGWITLGLSSYLSRERIDLYHSISMIAPASLTCPLLTTILDLTPILYPETHEWKWVWYFKQLLKKNCRNSAMIIVPSESTRNDLFDYLKPPRPPITVIPLGVEKSFSVPGSHVLKKIAEVKKKYGIDGPYIFSVGTLEPRKNQELLIDVFMELVKQDLKGFSLVLSGAPGWKHSSILNKIRQATGSLIYTGKINNEELRLLYRGASIFVYPSLYEGFGLPPLEAMASGCPVIASDTSSLRELLSGSALLVPPSDKAQLKSAILDLINDEDLQEKYIRRGLACASRFSWETTAREMLGIYQRLSRGGIHR